VERRITGYHRDDDGEWIAELDCGHHQHVRHRPPFQPREWVLTAEGRASRLHMGLSCRLCERAELPSTASTVRTSPIWDEHTMPAGLRRRHRLGERIWGLLVVHEGGLRCALRTQVPINVVLTPARTQALPPGVDHEVTPQGHVRFSIEFLTVDRAGGETPAEGGDAACWAGQVCPECGSFPGASGHQRAGCREAGSESPTETPPGRRPE
jgi:tellurite methyltransferase